jgi:hypothetical protein
MNRGKLDDVGGMGDYQKRIYDTFIYKMVGPGRNGKNT